MDYQRPVDISPHPVALAPRRAPGAALVIVLAMFVGFVLLCVLAWSAVAMASGVGLPL